MQCDVLDFFLCTFTELSRLLHVMNIRNYSSGTVPTEGRTPTDALALVRQKDNIEAGIFSIDCPVPRRDDPSDPLATAFVFFVESDDRKGYLALVSFLCSVFTPGWYHYEA